MNTQENNKLIAEFMGLSIKEGVSYYTDENDMFPMNVEVKGVHLPYDTDWNWLMPVVEKIESLGYEFFIVEDRIKIAHNTDHSIDTIINFTLGGSKREATYKAVVEFINQYNK